MLLLFNHLLQILSGAKLEHFRHQVAVDVVEPFKKVKKNFYTLLSYCKVILFFPSSLSLSNDVYIMFNGQRVDAAEDELETIKSYDIMSISVVAV